MSAVILSGEPGASLPAATQARIAEAAQQFEAMAIGQFLAPMFETIDTSKGLFGGGDGEAAWKPILVTELARHIAAHGGVGLARPVMEQMLRLQENAA